MPTVLIDPDARVWNPPPRAFSNVPSAHPVTGPRDHQRLRPHHPQSLHHLARTASATGAGPLLITPIHTLIQRQRQHAPLPNRPPQLAHIPRRIMQILRPHGIHRLRERFNQLPHSLRIHLRIPEGDRAPVRMPHQPLEGFQPQVESQILKVGCQVRHAAHGGWCGEGAALCAPGVEEYAAGGLSLEGFGGVDDATISLENGASNLLQAGATNTEPATPSNSPSDKLFLLLAMPSSPSTTPEGYALLSVQADAQNSSADIHDGFPPKQPVTAMGVILSDQHSDSLKPPRQPRPTFVKNLQRWWLEILSAFASAGCVVAIIVILTQVDGKLLSSWHTYLTPSATISILSTASKALMILPVSECISQLKWLQLTKTKHGLSNLQIFDNASRGPAGSFFFFFSAKSRHFLAYAGCFITVVAIAFDPCAQQVLRYVSKPHLQPGIHSSVTRSLVYDNGAEAVNGVSSVIGARDLPMRAAIMTGLYNMVQPAPFTCPGSNCTFPSFTSLGVCSQCTDVTTETAQNCAGKPPPPYVDICTYTTPSNLSLMAISTSDAHSGFQHTLVNTTVNSSASYVSGPDLMNLALLRFPDNETSMTPSDTWKASRQVYECSFRMCVHTYSNWTLTNGTTNPGHLSTTDVKYNGSSPILGYTTTNASEHYAINLFDTTLASNLLSTVFTLPADTDDQSIWQILSPALYAMSDIPSTMNKIATSMSHRMMDGPNATTVTGDVYAVDTFMAVQWKWVTLPVALVGLAAIFLGTVVVWAFQAGYGVWKSELEPLLVTESGDGEVDGWEEKRMRDIAERVRIY
ncbi:hypothetical protein FE257_003654 [Aspergillus nanangensis]|uniref:Uncharacterized protein n=1 Tax=Aspergillus nanangensis TaxID=2582783 RepID=A0AAD4GXJ7_ASPNN|nr:hypothetical protein FE257_003654 [Aspergillus nanangensis]